MEYIVTEIQRFCMHDGPGIRTTVFLKGCPLRCFWCHNPETQKTSPQLMYHKTRCIDCGSCAVCENGVHFAKDGHHGINVAKCTSCGDCAQVCPTGALGMAGKGMSREEIVEIVLRDKAFYGKEGGITLSGGEPMLHPEAAIALLRLAKERGLHTAIETCGFFPRAYVEPLAAVTDCFLWDVKDTDDERHQKNTGVSNVPILENLRYADTFGVPIVLRCILLKGINLNDRHLQKVGELYASLKNAVGVELLPCHAFGNSKGEALGMEPTVLDPYIPDEDEIEAARVKMRQFEGKKQGYSE